MSSVQGVDAFKNFQVPHMTTSSCVNAAPVETIPSASSNRALESLKNNKKAIIGGLAALTLAGIGIAYAIKRHKVPEEVKSAFADVHKLNDEVTQIMQGPVAKMTKEIDEITKKIQSKYDEVLELFNKGEEIAPDGTVLRKINDNIMSEFSKDGKSLIRETEFTDSLPSCIREFIEGTGKKNIYEYIDGKPSTYQQGCKILPDGSMKTAKCLDFLAGKPSSYQEGYERLAEGTSGAAKCLDFLDGKLSSYQENYKFSFADDTFEVPKWLGFLDGKPSTYQEGYEILSDGTEKAAKRLGFKYGKPVSYEEGYEKLADGTQFVDNWLDFVDGKWVKEWD